MMPNDLLQLVKVRRSVPGDAPAVVAAIEAVCAEGIYFQTDAFIPDRHWEAVLYRLESVPQHLLAVAELEGEIIGTVRLFAGMCGSKDQHVAELGIFVLPPYREQGVGKRLMTYALDWAAGQDLLKITLSVFATNQRAIHMYEQFGFVLEGKRKMQYNVGGEHVDEILMAKFLTR
jgi:RimJ/RimL family protein N-acetyltransferase